MAFPPAVVTFGSAFRDKLAVGRLREPEALAASHITSVGVKEMLNIKLAEGRAFGFPSAGERGPVFHDGMRVLLASAYRGSGFPRSGFSF